VLRRTARELFTAGLIATPGGVQVLVEKVYADPEDVRDGLKAALADEQGKESAAISIAKINVLAGWENGALTPWFADGDPKWAWALSEVSLAACRASGVPAPTGALASAVAAANVGWGRVPR
jgi:hypothetical protein